MEYLSGVKLRRELPERSYLKDLPPVRYLAAGNELRFDRPVTFLVGENGSGKSTLLEGIAVACGFNPEGGTRNFRIATRETHSELGEYLTPIRKGYPRDGFFLRAESFYNVASSIDEMDEGGILGPRVIDSYGGESLLKNRFGGEGLYLLDEPEAALSPSRLLTLLCEMRRLVELDSQFLIATHSPILMAYPGARLYQLGETGVHAVDYRETEHYQLTKRFLEDPERMLHYLLMG